jgi:Protein of unknown function (DUF1579)
MRPTHLLKTFALLCATASVAFAQSPSIAPTAPSLNSPASGTTTTTTSPATTTTTSAMPSESEMMKQMMELAKLNENHKLLASMDGTWTFVVKMWMNGDTTAKPQESKGTAVRKSIMGGRYVTMEVKGKMQMPDEKGKMKDMDFNGMAWEAYDNAKQKFVATWIDNMGTGIMMMEGTYDAASKTLTSTGEFQMTPTMSMKIREALKMPDKDHMNLEWFENRGGKEVKTMEINYTRGK